MGGKSEAGGLRFGERRTRDNLHWASSRVTKCFRKAWRDILGTWRPCSSSFNRGSTSSRVPVTEFAVWFVLGVEAICWGLDRWTGVAGGVVAPPDAGEGKGGLALSRFMLSAKSVQAKTRERNVRMCMVTDRIWQSTFCNVSGMPSGQEKIFRVRHIGKERWNDTFILHSYLAVIREFSSWCTEA